MGRIEECEREIELSREIDPLSYSSHMVNGWSYYGIGLYEKAIDLLEKASKLGPDYMLPYSGMGFSYHELGDNQKVYELAQKCLSVQNQPIQLMHPMQLGYSICLMKLSGHTIEAQKLLKELELRSRENTASGSLAWAYATMGEIDKAFFWLRKTKEERHKLIIYLKWPWMKNLHKDIRYTALLKEIGLTPLALKKKIGIDFFTEDPNSQKYEKSIVVLPFDDVSQGKDNEYFSDGLTEEIISDLSVIQAMRVISRTSSMMFKGTHKSMQTIARELDVQYILEGSVRKAGNNLRITAQLIDAANDAHIWAEKYSGTLDDVFDIQEKVSRSIVDALKLKLSAVEIQSMSERPFTNVKVYECYLKAKHEIDSFTEEGINHAIQHLESGLKIFGESAILYAGLGYAYWQYFNVGMQEDHLNKSLEYARNALELDPNSSEGHFITGNLHFFYGTPRDLRKIVFHLEKALSIAPNNCEALFHLELAYIFLGKTDVVASLIEKHLSIDPLSFYGHWSAFFLHLAEGRTTQALESVVQAYKLAPGVPPVEVCYAWGLAVNNRLDEAFAIIDRSAITSPDSLFTQLGVSLKYSLQGKKNEALQSVTPQLLAWGRMDFMNPWLIVQLYSLMGEKEEALNWLEEWIGLGCINYPLINNHSPFLENIRSEPRFKKLMDRVKHMWENFEV
jgi:TolB-like protein/Tfp pilus assembly protein PilF